MQKETGHLFEFTMASYTVHLFYLILPAEPPGKPSILSHFNPQNHPVSLVFTSYKQNASLGGRVNSPNHTAGEGTLFPTQKCPDMTDI